MTTNKHRKEYKNGQYDFESAKMIIKVSWSKNKVTQRDKIQKLK